MNTDQIKLVRFLLAQASLTEYKEDLCYAYSDERTEHLTDLGYDETKALIKYLKTVIGPGLKSRDDMTSKILSMAHEMHWEIPGTTRVDMKRINGWCIKYSGQNKPLDEFKYKELPTLVSQFEIVYRAFLKGI